MRCFKLFANLGLTALLAFLGGCASRSPQDYIEATEPVAASAFLPSPLHPATAVLIDREERLVLTTHQATVGRIDIKVIFPVTEDGKALVHKAAWEEKAKSDLTARGSVLISDPERDLAILHLDGVPRGVPELKLAKASPAKDAPLRFLGAPANGNLAWAAASSVVRSVGPRQVTVGNDRKATNQMIELDAAGNDAKGVPGGAVVNESNEVVGVVASASAQGAHMLCTDVSEVRVLASAAYRVLAMHANEAKQYDTALKYSERALVVWPDDALGYNERGAAYSRKDLFAKAVADYSQSIKLEPALALAWRNRGSAQLHLGKPREAIADCTQAIKLAPRYSSAYLKRGEAYDKLKMTREAEADRNTVAKLNQPKYKQTGSSGESSVGAEHLPESSRPPTASDPYYRGSGGQRFIVVAPQFQQPKGSVMAIGLLK